MTAINQIDEDLSDFPTLDEYQHLSSATAIYPGTGTALGLIYCALKMNGEAGEFAEHVGKAMRDDQLMEVGEPDSTREQKLVLELGDVLWYVAAAARELGYDLSEIAKANISKLQSRQARGTLSGSGDNR